MKSIIFSLLTTLLFSFGLYAQMPIDNLESHVEKQLTPCVSGVFSSSGNEYWKTITLTITNNCSDAVDLQDATITFQNTFDLETSCWGRFYPLSYPDDLRITSQRIDTGLYLSTLHFHFPYDSNLPAGRSFYVRYGAKSSGYVQGTVNVYLDGDVSTGSIGLTNTSARPSNVDQNYALVHIMSNGQNITDIQLPWEGNEIVDGLAPATYTLSADNVSDSNGNTYQGTVNPSTINLTDSQDGQATVSYVIAPEGRLAIQLEALPTELTGYTGKPVAVVRETGGGSSVSVNLDWNTITNVSQLKNNVSYSFSTPSFTYNGIQCNPIFTPATLTAQSTTFPLTRLTYQLTLVPVIENTATINVSGAPTSLSSLDVTLTPNSGNAIETIIPLTNGGGSNSVLLPDGVAYTVSAEPVSGYSFSFVPQPLISKPNVIETISLAPITTGTTPVAINGQLKVIGTQLCNENNQPIQLRGMSTHGIQWYYECLTSASLNALVNDFKASVLRISLYVQEDGYETDPVGFTNKVNQLIKEASDRGIYALVDWHMLEPGDPNYNFERARKFFTDIANANKGRKNLIYEIANEPSGVSWSTIKSYADRLIPIIRAIDPNTVILVGTVAWSSLGVSDGRTSQDIINAPVNFPNIMYTFHFYAASHGNEYLSELDRASNVLPIFVTEFGTQTYTGDGANNFTMSDRYMELMARKKISWTNWNYSDDFRSGAIWKTGTCPNGPWTDTNLKPAGIYIKNKIRG